MRNIQWYATFVYNDDSDDDDERRGIIHIVQYQNNWESVDQNILIGFYQNIGQRPYYRPTTTLSWFSRKAGYKLLSPEY